MKMKMKIDRKLIVIPGEPLRDWQRRFSLWLVDNWRRFILVREEFPISRQRFNGIKSGVTHAFSLEGIHDIEKYYGFPSGHLLIPYLDQDECIISRIKEGSERKKEALLEVSHG